MVVIGVFSADYALRRINETGSQDVSLNIQAKVVAESVRVRARALHGDPLDTGFYRDTGTQTFCFRHDDVSGGVITPNNYTDDMHSCYTQIGTTVYLCEKAAAAACLNTDLRVGQLVSDQFTKAAIPLPAVTVTAAGDYYFEMTLVGRLDPSAGAACSPAACTAGATLTAGTAANPQVVIKIQENAAGF
jgi:hypothetical protein